MKPNADNYVNPDLVAALSAPLVGSRYSSATPQERAVNGATSLSALFSLAHIGILHRDLDNRVLVVNDQYQAIVGLSAEELEGLPMEAFTHPGDRKRSSSLYARQLARAEAFEVEKRYIRPDGSFIWCAVHVSFVVDDSGRPISTISVAHDITTRRVAEQELRESEERLRIAAQAAGLGIWDYDAVRDHREWSKELRDMLGIGPDAQPEITTAMALVIPEDRPLLESLIVELRDGVSESRYHLTLRIRREDTGAERWMRLSGWRMEASPGKLSRVLITVRDVTEDRAAEERIRWIAEHDALTGLPNRAAFNAHLERSITAAQEAGEELALLLFDMDNLKTTNDTTGHDAGDVLLQTFMRRLVEALPPGCTVGRLGGDEFAVLIDAADECTLKPLLTAA